MKSRVGALLFAVFVFLIASRGIAASQPDVQQVLDKFVEASGGRAALQSLKSRVMIGEVEMSALGIKGACEIMAKAPNKQVSKTELGSFGTMREGFDGTVAWSVAPIQGARVKEGADLARVQRTTLFPRELKLKEAYSRMEVKGVEKVNGMDTWVVEAAPKTGKPDRFYFDQKTGFLVREESTVSTMVGELNFQVDYADFREVDGVKVPFSVHMTKPAELRIEISSVKHNVDLKDELFSKPAE